MKEYVYLTMPDYSEWRLQVSVILDNYIKYLVEYDDMSEEDAREIATQLFEGDSYEINDWLMNNMNWNEFSDHLFKVSDPKQTNYENDWNCSNVIVS